MIRGDFLLSMINITLYGDCDPALRADVAGQGRPFWPSRSILTDIKGAPDLVVTHATKILEASWQDYPRCNLPTMWECLLVRQDTMNTPPFPETWRYCNFSKDQLLCKDYLLYTDERNHRKSGHLVLQVTMKLSPLFALARRLAGSRSGASLLNSIIGRSPELL